MLCKPKKSALYRRIRRIICVFLIVIISLSAYLEFAVKAQLSDVIAAGMKDLALSAVDSAVVDYLKENPDIGERLTRARYSDSGAVTSLISDPTAVNTLKRRSPIFPATTLTAPPHSKVFPCRSAAFPDSYS